MAVFLGLLIPFLGILVPAVVVLALGASHRGVPPVADAPAGLALETDALEEASSSPSAVSPFDVAGRPELVGADEVSWLCACLRESDVFEGLTDSELRLVVAIGERRHVAARGRLADAGTRGETLFVILKGEVRLLTHGPYETPVRVARAGETVPLAAIIDPPVLVTTVEASDDCDVFAIPRAPLLDLFETHPAMGFQVYRAAAKAFEHRYRQTLDHSGGVVEGGSGNA